MPCAPTWGAQAASWTARIATPRRGEAIRGVGSLNGDGVKTGNLAYDHERSPPNQRQTGRFLIPDAGMMFVQKKKVRGRSNFFPEIEEVGFSLDSIPGLRSVLCHFAVTPSRFRPRPRGSLDLVEEKRSVVSDP